MGETWNFDAKTWRGYNLWTKRTIPPRSIETWFELIPLLVNSHTKCARYDDERQAWMIDGKHEFHRTSGGELWHLSDMPACIQVENDSATIRYIGHTKKSSA